MLELSLLFTAAGSQLSSGCPVYRKPDLRWNRRNDAAWPNLTVHGGAKLFTLSDFGRQTCALTRTYWTGCT